MEKNGSSKQINKPADLKTALNRAAALCSKQEQCSGQVLDKLEKWGLGEKDREKVLKHLIRENYVDDNRFAVFFVRDKFRMNGWGRTKIRYMLQQKRIPDEVIGRALEEINEEAYFAACVSLVKQKSAGLKDKNLFARKGKLFRYASGRGFEPDVIHRAISFLSLPKTDAYDHDGTDQGPQ